MNATAVEKKSRVATKSAPKKSAAAAAKAVANERYVVGKLSKQEISNLLGKKVRVHNAIGARVNGYGLTATLSSVAAFRLHSMVPHRISKPGDMLTIGLLPDAAAEDPLFPSTAAHYYVTPDVELEVLGEAPATPEAEVRKKQYALAQTIRTNKYHRSIGTDPELFVVDKKGELIPAFTFLPKRYDKEITPYWDGYQAEFGTIPTTCLAEQNREIARGLGDLKHLAAQVGGTLSVRNTFDIPQERLATDEDEHVAFGCTPSLSVYKETFPTEDPRTVPFRTAGGHMHFEYSDTKNIPTVIRELDRILSVIGVSLYQYYDEPRRRMLYGRAGEYRVTDYGFEYRTPGPSWLVHPFFINFQFELARRVIGVADYRQAAIKEWVASEEEVRECINTCDVALAHKIISRNKLTFESLMAAMPAISDVKRHEILINAVLNGAHTVLKRPDEIVLLDDPRTARTAYNMSSGICELVKGNKI